MPQLSFAHVLKSSMHSFLLMDMLLFGLFLFLPNVLVVLNLVQTSPSVSLFAFFEGINVLVFTGWLVANLTLGTLLYISRRHVFYPLYATIKQVYIAFGTLLQEPEAAPTPAPAPISMRRVALDMARMAKIAQDYYVKHREATEALIQARAVLGQINAQQRIILNSTSREMVTQYQSVLAYANYLEERIAARAANPDLRYDFDEVCESGFNLKLIAGALNLIEQRKIPELAKLDVPQLMQQTMLALAPSLDRRAMKLTTVEVDLEVLAQSNPEIIAHVLWMMLLGTIRYAADESTLRLRCLYNRDRTRTLISIVVSELSPGRLTEDERGAFLARQIQHITPHMFAETIRIHANLQLAEMLMALLDGSIAILPLTTQSCEICLNLPAFPME